MPTPSYEELKKMLSTAVTVEPPELTGTQRHRLLNHSIESINSMYYENMDMGKLSGTCTALISSDQIPKARLNSEFAILSQGIQDYFNNIFDPIFPHKKFHIQAVQSPYMPDKLAVILKWGHEADIANNPDKFQTPFFVTDVLR